MKKILSIVLLLFTVSLAHAISLSDLVQKYEQYTNPTQPAAVSPAPATTPAPAGGSSFLARLVGAMDPNQPATVATTSAADRPAVAAPAYQVALEKIVTNAPSLIANIKLLAPKALEIAAKSAQGGWFSGLTSAFTSMDTESRAAFLNLVTQVGSVATAARSLLASADPATQATVKGVLAQIVAVPEFKTLLDQAKNIPLVGGQLDAYLQTLTAEAR